MPIRERFAGDCRRSSWFAAASLLIAACQAISSLHADSPTTIAVSSGPPAADQYWPQWRGPLSTGASPTAHPPTEWSEEKNIKWKVAIAGEGSATPIIWGNQVFVQTAIPTGKKLEPVAEAADAVDPVIPATSPGDPKDSKVAKDSPPTTPPAGGAPPGADKGSGKGGGKGPPGGKGRGFGPTVPKPDEYYQFVLMSLDRQTGQEQWRKVVAEVVPHEGHHPDHGYASNSPVTDGTCVIAYFGSRGLHCYDMQGNLKWELDLGKMRTIFTFGEGSSPALFGNTVVVTWDHEDGSFIVALDKETGRELWRTPREEKTTWATPLIVSVDGEPQVITSGTQKARGYSLADGKQIWECSGLTPSAVPSPVAADGVVYVMTGYRGSALLAIRFGRTGDLTGTDAVVWKFDKDTPYVPSPLLLNGKLWCFKVNQSIISCFNVATGERLYGPERLDGAKEAYASPVGADGKVYLVGRNGTTLVIGNGDTFEVLATNELGEGIDASPALAGNELFLRGKQHLYCISAN